MRNETQILAPEYVQASLRAWGCSGFPEEADNGYHKWVYPLGLHSTFFTAGHGGQYLWIVRHLDLIAVTTAEYRLLPPLIQDHRFLITDFVVPAVLPNML
jgi:hypothetical protein